MSQLLESLRQLLVAVWNVVQSLLGVFEPNLGLWLFLAAWIGYFLFAVNWVALRRVMLSGGWVGVLLLALVSILVWGSVDPATQPHEIFGLQLSNYVGKTVYVTVLLCIMLVCGSVQLANPARTDVDIAGYEE
ncbi:hypothetical protein [Thalassoroseus pseudoceratinae]|uniref:hypothetical protein n=1 Tax=Thalassoroseus pseudoceratinae TaxID=2713176 RepID=UPI00141F5776|nr:hypothetical protein [Thalassoroseus pseudoceratinae]